MMWSTDVFVEAEELVNQMIDIYRKMIIYNVNLIRPDNLELLQYLETRVEYDAHNGRGYFETYPEKYADGIYNFESFYWFLRDIDYYHWGDVEYEWEDDDTTGLRRLTTAPIETHCDDTNGQLYQQARQLRDDQWAAEFKRFTFYVKWSMTRLNDYFDEYYK